MLFDEYPNGISDGFGSFVKGFYAGSIIGMASPGEKALGALINDT